MDPELGADEGHRAVGGGDLGLGTGEILLDGVREPLDRRERDRVERRGCSLGREIVELPDRVAAVELPGMRVERAEQLRPSGLPRPAVVEGDPREGHELIRERGGKPRGALARLARAGKRADVDVSVSGHGRPT